MSQPSPRPLVAVVSHTHWDREWYLPVERFRLRLINLVTGLLDMLDQDPGYEHFMLDGQAVALEDVLELRPDLEPRLREHMRAGRLSAGPWYVLQDEFLVGGESLVHNLLEGQRVVRRFGEPMRVGYLPDAFGHVAQIPRLLQGFGLESTALWRGVGDRAPGVEWRWRAPGGAEVLCVWLANGYGNAAALPEETAPALERLRADLDRQAPLSQSRVLLWLNGSDHLWPQPHLPRLLAALRAEAPDVDILHTGLDATVAAITERLDVSTLPVVEGELRRPGGGSPILPGVLSARTWDQREHDVCELLLARSADPFAALSGQARKAELRHAWRLLLRCQPHDSICGCSVDTTHDEIAIRLGRAAQVAGEVRDDAVRAMVGETATVRPLFGGLALASPHPYAATARIRTQLHLPRDWVSFRLVGPQGEVPFDERGSVLSEREVPDPFTRPSLTRRVTVDLLAEDMPAHGVRVLKIEEGAPAACAKGLARDGQGISNGLISVQPIPGGVEVTDLASGAKVVHRFEDQTDRGDEYNFDPVPGEAALDSAQAEPSSKVTVGAVSACLTVKAEWRLPKGLGDDRCTRAGKPAKVAVRLKARLLPGTRRVELSVRVVNKARDHRLRARFDLDGAAPQAVLTDSPLGWVERAAGTPPPAEGREQPVPTCPISSAAVVDLPEARLALGSVGLRELELGTEGALWLTILRCVGWLSRGDLVSRLEHAGPYMETPGAQGIGTHRFRYCLAFGERSAPREALVRELEPGLMPPAAISLREAEPSERWLVSLEPASVRLSAVKVAEEDDRLIVRVLGAHDADARVRLRLGVPVGRAWRSDLDERVGEPLPVSDDEVAFDLPANEVATLAFERRPDE